VSPYDTWLAGRSVTTVGIQSGCLELLSYKHLKYPGYLNKEAYDTYLKETGLWECKHGTVSNPHPPADTHNLGSVEDRQMYRRDMKLLKDTGSSLTFEYEALTPYAEFVKKEGVEPSILDCAIDCGCLVTTKLEDLEYRGYLLRRGYRAFLAQVGLAGATGYRESK